MSEYRFNDQVSFDLPWDYEYNQSIDDAGNEIDAICKGRSIDEDGEESCEFKCTIREVVAEGSAIAEGKTLKELWVTAFQQQENIKYLTLPGKPDTLMMTLGTSINIFGKMLRIVSLTMMVAVDESSFLTIIGSKGYDEENPELYLPLVENMLTVARSMRINGKGNALEGVTASAVFEALKPSFDGSAPVESSIQLQLNMRHGGQTTTYTYGDDGVPAVTSFEMTQAQPDETLYPHYKSIQDSPASLLGMLGANAVVNATGTEYEFKSLRRELELGESDSGSGLSDTYRAVYQRLVAADNSGYTLQERAKEMLPLFRVDPSVFDSRHDRECELAEGYMHRAYMMSALRSFAWTMSDWCAQKKLQPEDLRYSDLRQIIGFISDQEWLNYDADTYCAGLCGCQDLHVYYVPDAAVYRDKQALLPEAAYLAQVAAMKKRFPGYKDIPAQVHSLDALRKDLAYIQPAIETIYQELEEERNPMDPLAGDPADILYAWCALALAAKEPFFTEDGPTNCCFVQRTGGAGVVQPRKQNSGRKKPQAKRAASGDCKISISGILDKYSGDDTAILLPEGINAIGTEAFLFNTTLKTVVFSEEVETIDEDAFWGCEALEEVVFPDSLRTICKNAFRSCKALKSIVIPEGVQEIGKDAFTNCVELKDIYLPDSLWDIGEDAFCTFNDETTIHAPKGSDAARYAKENGLKLDHKKPEEIRQDVEDGIDFEQSNSTLLSNGLAIPVPYGYHCCPEGTGVNAGWAYVVPETTAFDSNHIDAKPFSFAVTVSSGAHIAFRPEHMEALKRVFLSKGYLAPQISVESLIVSDTCGFLYQNRIDKGDATYNKVNGFLFAGEDVFQFHIYANYNSGTAHEQRTAEEFLAVCREWMQRVRLGGNTDPRQLTPEECQINEDGVFEGYFGDKTDIILPDTVREIDSFCKFADTVRTVTMPDSVTSMKEYAFCKCTGLTHITISKSVTVIAPNAFNECLGLTSVTIPEGVVSIGEYAFYKCSALEKIVIADSVKEIGAWAFAYCTGLREITMPAIENVDSLAFYGTEGIESLIFTKKSVVVPKWVRDMPESLTHVVIPEGVTSIKENAFRDCCGLTEIIIPESVTSIAKNAFMGCTGLTKVTIPGSVVSVGESAFDGCSGLTELTISDGVVSLGEYAFSQCTALENVVIPQSVETIGAYAFCNCTGLHTVAMPDLTMDFGSVFLKCDHLSRVILVPGSSSVPFGFCYLKDSLEEIVIPEGVTSVAEETFSECAKLTSIVLPDSLEVIESGAFLDCTGLTSIVLGAGLTEIGGIAFCGCTALEQVVLPEGLRIIGEQAFSDCAGLKTITVPESVTEIGDDAFDSDILIRCCRNSAAHEYAKQQDLNYMLIDADGAADPEEENMEKDITATGDSEVMDEPQPSQRPEPEEVSAEPQSAPLVIPGTVKAIEDGAFSGNDHLEEVVIEEGVESIGDSAFSQCAKLTSIRLPDSLKTIGAQAFTECSGLKTVKLPAKLKGTLENNIFSFCSALEQIVLPAGITAIGDSAFLCCDRLKDIHLPPFIKEIRNRAFLGIPEDAVFHVIKGSYPERYCQEQGYRYDYKLDPELLKILQAIVRAKKAQAEAQQKTGGEQPSQERMERFQKFVKAMEQLKRIVSQNPDPQSQNYREAQARLAQLQAQFAKEFPGGQP